MKESLTRRFTVSSFDLDPRSEARLTSLAAFFQEMAYQHASRLGFGYHDLLKEQTFWVLSRMKIHIMRYPVWDEEILVETWPCGLDGLFAMRDFRITSDKQEVLGMATTSWLVVDGRTRRPVRPSEALEKYREGQDRPFEEKLQKIDLPPDMVPAGLHRMVYSDLDVVGHVNNVKYMEWCIDAAGQPALDRRIGRFEINFMHESHFGEEISITASADRSKEIYFLGRRTGDDREIFRAHLVLDPS